MNDNGKSKLPDLLRRQESEILSDWMRQQAIEHRGNFKESEIREQSRDLLAAMREAVQGGNLQDVNGREWAPVRDMLDSIARFWAKQGFSATETATFVFSLKLPLFSQLRREYGTDAAGLAAEIWTVTTVIDKLGLVATEAYMKGRDEIISRQQQEMLELSTPVVRLWENILALPLIGTLDSARTQVVMENLLQQIVSTGAEIAIIDITGVPTVDTLVAQHLLKTVAAARLMGADCIISGIRPQIAQTIVHLGVELGDVTTKATLADAFAIALRRAGMGVVKLKAKSAE